MLTSYLFTFHEYQYNIDNFTSMFIMAGIKKKMDEQTNRVRYKIARRIE